MAEPSKTQPSKRRAPLKKHDAHTMFLEAAIAISGGTYKNNGVDKVVEAQNVQSFAMLQAAALIAAAIDRYTAAIKAIAKTNAP